MENTRIKRFLETFNAIPKATENDLYNLAKGLTTDRSSILSSLPSYKLFLEEMKDKDGDINVVIDKLKSLGANYLTDATILFLETIRDINNKTLNAQMDISNKLSLVGAVHEVVFYNGYMHTLYKSDIARTYIETMEDIFNLAINKKFKSKDEEIANKRRLIVLTNRVLNDLNAYMEIMIWARNNHKVLTLVVHIATFFEKDFFKVDTLIRIMLDVADPRLLLTTAEKQIVLDNIGACAEITRYSNYQ